MSLLLQKISSFQFLFEQLLNNRLGNPSDKSHLLEVLSILELGKAYLKLVQMNSVSASSLSPNQLYLSIRNEQSVPESPVEPAIPKEARSILEQMQSLPAVPFRPEQSYLKHQNKLVPVEQRVRFPKSIQALGMREKSHCVLMGELVFTLRPVVYCFLLRRFGVRSYLPYLISLLLDLVRLLLQKNIRFYRQEEKDEFIHRNKELLICYLLRNPVYEGLVKRVIQKVLNKLVPQRLSFVSQVVFLLVEFRCSLSLLM